MSDWLSNLGTSIGNMFSNNTPTMQGYDFSNMAQAGYQVPTSEQMNNPANFQNTATPTDWSAVAKSLGNLSSSTGATAGSSGSTGGTSSTKTAQASSEIGRPAHPVDLSTLVTLLQQRANQYFPGTANRQPVSNKPSTGGLLGY